MLQNGLAAKLSSGCFSTLEQLEETRPSCLPAPLGRHCGQLTGTSRVTVWVASHASWTPASDRVLHVCRTSEHVDCITYLLRQGADAFLMTSGGDNCLHIAAKNAHSHCLWHLLAAWISVRHKPPCHLADAVFSDDLSQLKFVDLPNGKVLSHVRLPHNLLLSLYDQHGNLFLARQDAVAH